MGVGRNNGSNGFRQTSSQKREAKSAKRKQKSYKASGLTTTKASIPTNIHTGLALSGAPPAIKSAKKVKVTGRVVVKTSVSKAAVKKSK